MALSSTAIVKIIVVTDDLERTVGAYERLLWRNPGSTGRSGNPIPGTWGNRLPIPR